MLYRVKPQVIWLLAAVWGLVVVLLGALFFAGGDDHDERQSVDATPTETSFSIESQDLKWLPKAERESPPLDDGHLIVPIPEQWELAPRSNRWLVRMRRDDGQPYPAILVTGGENTDTDEGGNLLQQLDESNLETYTKRLQAKLEKELKKGSLAEDVHAIQVGDVYAVEYVQFASSKGDKLDRLIVVVLSSGRRYEVELRTRRGTLIRYRPQLYAVVGRIKIS